MDELSADAREILAEMRRADTPRAGARDRVRRQLALSIASAASLSVAGSAAASSASAGAHAAAAGSSAIAGVSVGKLSVLVALGALGGSAVLTPVALLSEPARSPAKTAEVAPRRVAVKSVTQPVAPPELPLPKVETLPDVSAPALARRLPPRASRGEAEPARAAASLASETRLLEAVRERLRAGQAAEGIALLDQHARAYPNGALREEAYASRVFALCALGRAEEGRAAAARFQATFPRSPLGPRVARACAPRERL